MKKLPRAVLRTSAQMRASSVASTDWNATDGTGAAERAAAAGPYGCSGNVIEIPPKPSAGTARVAAQGAPTPPPQRGEDREAALPARRRSRAMVIVERHATYAAAGGLLPLPVVNVSCVVAVILRMVKRLSAHYGVPFDRNLTRAMVMALIGGAMPTGLASATASALALLLPSSGIFGIAVSSVAAAAFTRGIGLVFIDHFESGATFADLHAPAQ